MKSFVIRIQHGTGFEQRDVHTEIGEDFDRRAATGARADHDDVEDTVELRITLAKHGVLNITRYHT